MTPGQALDALPRWRALLASVKAAHVRGQVDAANVERVRLHAWLAIAECRDAGAGASVEEQLAALPRGLRARVGNLAGIPVDLDDVDPLDDPEVEA